MFPASNQGLTVTVVTEAKSVVIESKIVSAGLGISHRSLLQTISKHLESIESNFGAVAFQMREHKTSQGNKAQVRVAHLTEDQAYFIITLSRNSPKVKAFKAAMVKAFSLARKELDQWNYKREFSRQSYRSLTDAVKSCIEAGTIAGKFAYSQEADLINMLVFGKRSRDVPGNLRDSATPEQLEEIAELQQYDAVLIEEGCNYQDRKKRLWNKLLRIRAKNLKQLKTA
jgi:phage regulator Rha-like protein